MSVNSTVCMTSAHNTFFQRRVKYFMTKAATAIIGEESTTAGHTERLAFAKEILAGTANILEFAVGVTTNGTIAASIVDGTEVSDSDLEFTVNSLINDFAGYDG